MTHTSRHHALGESPYTVRSPSVYLGSFGRQEAEGQEYEVESGPTLQRGQDGRANHGTRCQTPQQGAFSTDMIGSPELNNATWDDFSASSWDIPAQIMEHQGQSERGHILQLQMPPHRSYASEKAANTFAHAEHPFLPAQSILSGASPMDFPLSASASPGSEILLPEPFAPPLTPASLNLEPAKTVMTGRNSLQQNQYCHVRTTPSPSRSTSSPEYLRRKPASAGPKGTSSVGKVAKGQSPKGAGPTSNPANARSAHSAIERKYRENINSKIAELHKVLCSAGPALFLERDLESGGYPYCRLPRAEDDDCSGVDSSSTSGQTSLPAKKADVLAGAISYVKRSEKEKKMLLEQLNSRTAHLQHLEAVVRGQNNSLA